MKHRASMPYSVSSLASRCAADSGAALVWITLTIVAILILIALAAVPAAALSIERMSVSSTGAQANTGSTVSSLSADGRLVAFASSASNLVPGDTNAQFDVFVRDRETGVTERVSVNSSGAQATGSSIAPAVSADGRTVAFASTAPNLVTADLNGRFDVFVHDRETGATERVSVATGGGETNADSFAPAISADGRFVAFVSGASNLVPGDTNAQFDVFVRDRTEGVTERFSIGASGVQVNGMSLAPRISADGGLVVFHSFASNLVAGDSNGWPDVFVFDRASGVMERVSVASNGAQGNGQSVAGSLSADGRFVAFSSDATSLVPGDTNGTTDVLVHDRETGSTERVSVASDGSQATAQSGFLDPPAISADGRFVAFLSAASNLVPNDGNNVVDVFRHDRLTGDTERMNVATSGAEANAAAALWPGLSADARVVVFASMASNLVASDTNFVQDIFVAASNCGNGRLDESEECDDGNLTDGDCCTEWCELEPAGNGCDDDDLCTREDVCDGAGTCVGGNPVVCTASADECLAPATCDQGSGECAAAAMPDGTPCQDGDACTADDLCIDGECVSGDMQPAACLDVFACRFPDGKGIGKQSADGVWLKDLFASRFYFLGSNVTTCTSLDAPGDVEQDVSRRLACRRIWASQKMSKQQPLTKRTVAVRNELGEERVAVYDERTLCSPADAAEGSLPVLDRFKCYRARPADGEPPFRALPLELAELAGWPATSFARAAALCNPVEANGEGVEHPFARLVCYRRKDPAATSSLELDDERPPRLCVPSLAELVMTPGEKGEKSH